jgi:hypothetical protein
MAGFEVDPGQLRLTARDVAEVAARVDSLARWAAALAQTPVRQHFPKLAEARDAAARWDEALETFAVGIRRVARALGRLSEGVTKAAEHYEAVDVVVAQRNEAIRDQAA